MKQFSCGIDVPSPSVPAGVTCRGRAFGIALRYEDLNDHDQLRRDPVMAVLIGKPG
jgi:hypothetical protein